MNVRWLKQVFSAAAIGSTMLISSASFSGDHRMFPDEPQRPHVSAACQPNWGFNQTCWQRFPPVAPCPNQGDCQNGQCGLNPVYVPQSIHNQVLPTQPMDTIYQTPATQYAAPIMSQPAPSSLPSHFPAPMSEPSFLNPQPSMIQPPMQTAPPAGQAFEAPGHVPALPPLPAPLPAAELPQQPVPAVPNQSRIESGRQDYRTNAPQMAPVAKLPGTTGQNRYGDRAAMAPMPGTASAHTNRYAGASRSIAQQHPVAPPTTVMSEPQPQKSTAAPTNLRPTMRYTSGKTSTPVMPASSARYLKQVR